MAQSMNFLLEIKKNMCMNYIKRIHFASKQHLMSYMSKQISFQNIAVEDKVLIHKKKITVKRLSLNIIVNTNFFL